ncbi:hypothetical protein FACS1894201_09570 [Bacteroidia bacterium]|nr:hypothetical protein FACS1894201_09570 [Bacteroidia bacterium]
MKTVATILFFVLTHLTFAQTVFTVDGFTKDYYGKVEINDTSEVFSKGWIAIYDKKTDKQIIKVVSDELALSLHDGKAIANIKSLPYGEQSLIMYDDFNFDNKKDFAICDGQNSCYHGPSFKIYLATDKGFSFNEAFTRLAQEYCGMFQVDYSEKKISTMTKSGCCWHEFSEFVVENNKPKAIKIITDEQDLPFNIFTEQTWNGKTMVKKTTKTIDIDQEEIQVILSFIVPENGKKIILYNINDRILNYALVRRDSTVEFSYPIETVYQNPDFKFDNSSTNRSVTFLNKSATYKIYDRPTELGMEITIDGKTYNLVGDNKTRTGGLDNLLKVQLDNVVNQ